LSQAVEAIERSDELSASMMEEKSIRARIDELSSEWAQRAVCKALLERTRHRYEREKQPRVIREASTFVSKITDDAYTGLYAPLGQDDIQLETREGIRRDVSKLSRGTREQLYLSLRFGLIREYGSSAEPLPVIMDDILVNFDPVRSKAAARAIVELSQTNQIIFFTCHPATVGMFTELGDDLALFDVGDGRVTKCDTI